MRPVIRLDAKPIGFASLKMPEVHPLETVNFDSAKRVRGSSSSSPGGFEFLGSLPDRALSDLLQRSGRQLQAVPVGTSFRLLGKLLRKF